MLKSLLHTLLLLCSTSIGYGQYQSSNALHFDGVDDYVNLNDMRLLLDTTTNFAIEFWVKADSNDQANNQSVLVSIQRPSENARFIIYMGGLNSQEGKLMVQNDLQPQPNFISNRLIGDNQCHHIAYVEQGSVGTIYIDGQIEGSVNHNTGFSANDKIYLGSRVVSSVPEDNFFGSLDDVRFWNTSRTQSEIQSKMNNSLDTIPTNLMAYFHFDQGIPSGNNASLSNVLTNPCSSYNVNGLLQNFAKTGSVSNFVGPGCAMLDYELLAGSDITMCEEQSYTLSAQNRNIANHLWENIGPDGTVIQADTSRYFVVSGFANNGVYVEDSFYLQVLEIPQLTRTNNDTLCQFSTISLTASGADLYDWGHGLYTDPDTLIYLSTDLTLPIIAQNNNGCSVYDTIRIKTLNAPIIDLPDSTNVCRLDSVSLSVTGNFTFNWQNGTHFDSTFSYLPLISEWIEVKATSSNNCQYEDSTFVLIQEHPDFELNIPSITICENESYRFELPVNFDYQWNNDITTNTADSSIVFDEHQYYYLNAVNSAGCTTRDSVLVLVKNAPEVTFVGPTSVCSGESVAFEISGNGIAFDFGNGFTENNKSFFNLTSSDFIFYRAQNQNGCEAHDSVFIAVLENPIVFAGSDTVICPNTPIVFEASGAESYDWSSGINQAELFSPEQEQFFYVEGTDANGCKSVDSLFVSFSDNEIAEPFIPEMIVNVFTPNGDSFNPEYRPFRLEQFEIDELFFYIDFYQLTIVNRWGETIFQTTDLSAGWDGTNNGQPVSEGAYFAIIEYLPKCHSSKTPLKFSSSVQLIR